MVEINFTKIKEVGFLLADAAREASLAYFRSDMLISDNKAELGFDPVTQADRAAEKAMRAILAEHCPADGIIGEEFGRVSGASGIDWVLDPIDGTRAFVAGAPTWGVLIAASYQGMPVFGLIDQPFISERFWGFGDAAYYVGPKSKCALRTRGETDLTKATLCSTFPEIGTGIERQQFSQVASQVRLVRYGLDCYAYALLAAGHIDLVIEAGLNVYDINAPIALIRAAGGVVTNWQGGPPEAGGQVIAAANKALLEAALGSLNKSAA